MHRKQRHEHEGDISHSEDGVFAVYPSEEACRVEDERVEGDKDDVRDAIAVQILGSGVKSGRIEVNHFSV